MKTYSCFIAGNGSQAVDFYVQAEKLKAGELVKWNGQLYSVTSAWIDAGQNNSTGGANVIAAPSGN